MRILLINPPDENAVQEFPDDEGNGYLEADDYGSFPPLGALYVLSYIRNKFPQHEYFFKDCVGEKISHQKLPDEIREIKPDIVGITSFTISLVDVVLSARIVRDIVPNAHICLGGHHPTAFPYEASQLQEFDSIIVGEGEYAFASLVEHIENNMDFTTIKGVYTKSSIEKYITQNFKDRRFLGHLNVPPAYVENVDDIPIPDRSFIKHIQYESIVGLTGSLATIITTRGCPYKCTFCDVPYKTYRQRDVELVMDEIEMCISLGYKEFHFYDDLFNITAQKIIDFCIALERRNLNIIWDFRGRVNGVTFESLERAKSVGLRMISFGVETGTDLGHKTLKKGSNIAQVEQVFMWCKKLGIKTIANYMIGLPHEKSREDVFENINFLIQLKPDYAQIAILNLYPHTQVFKDAIKMGMIEDGRWEKFALDPKPGFKVDHWTEFLSERDLVYLHRESYRRFYFRISYVAKNITNIKSFHELKSKIRGFFKLLNLKKVLNSFN